MVILGNLWKITRDKMSKNRIFTKNGYRQRRIWRDNNEYMLFITQKLKNSAFIPIFEDYIFNGDIVMVMIDSNDRVLKFLFMHNITLTIWNIIHVYYNIKYTIKTFCTRLLHISKTEVVIKMKVLWFRRLMSLFIWFYLQNSIENL